MDEFDKKRNNSLIVSNRNNNIFNFDNNKFINININNNICSNCNSNGSQGHCLSNQENKNNTSSSTVYSSVSYYNNTSRERDTHKKVLDTSNPSFKFNML